MGRIPPKFEPIIVPVLLPPEQHSVFVKRKLFCEQKFVVLYVNESIL
jgi:hypothetical protein